MLVLKRVRLGAHHCASRTRHTISDTSGKRAFPPFIELVIAADPGETGCYLFHVCADGQVADTWHQSIDEALGQAEWEFGVQPKDWIVPGLPETF